MFLNLFHVLVMEPIQRELRTFIQKTSKAEVFYLLFYALKLKRRDMAEFYVGGLLFRGKNSHGKTGIEFSIPFMFVHKYEATPNIWLPQLKNRTWYL